MMSPLRWQSLSLRVAQGCFSCLGAYMYRSSQKYSLPLYYPAMPLLSKTSRTIFNSFHPRTQFNTTPFRSFHASSANMVIKTYFDCEWTGPEVSVDSNGNVTNTGREPKGELPLSSSSTFFSLVVHVG